MPSGRPELREFQQELMRLPWDDLRASDVSYDSPTAEQIYECAEHLAAVLMLTDGQAWIRDVSRADRPVTCSTVDELRRSATFRDGATQDLDAVLVRTTLRSALFAGRGDQVDFAHRTYAEFLAADCLRTRGFDVNYALRLLRDPGDPFGRVAPRLRGVAAWWAAMVPDARRLLGEHEPQIILRAGAQCYHDAEARERLVTRILDGIERGVLTEEPYDASLYTGLSHPRLEEQLASYLRNRATSDAVWRVSRSMATACGIRLPFVELAGIACDPQVPAQRRAFAATLVAEGDDSAAKEALRPVLCEQHAPDGVFGTVLKVLWPASIGVEGLLAVLRPPRDEHVFDRYHDFLYRHLYQGLRIEDVPTLLIGLGGRSDVAQSRALARVLESLLHIGWDHLHLPAVAEAFARVFLNQLLRVIEQEEEMPLTSLIDDHFYIDSAGGWPGTRRELTRHTEDRCREILQRIVVGIATRAPPVTKETLERVFDVLVLADPPLARRADRAWLAVRCDVAPVVEQPVWFGIVQRLDESDALLASSVALRGMYPGSRFLSDVHRAAIRVRPWLQRVHSWREVPRSPSDASTDAGSAPVIASAKLTPDGPTETEQRASFDALRRNVQQALARTRLPVRGPSDLLDAVLASLRRLDEELQGMTPQAFMLWNETAGRCWPKVEDDLSDVVAAHLRRDLPSSAMVVTREMEVRRGDGYLDLLIQAPGLSRNRRAQMIIEVKGSWNPGLDSAMRGQLVERYMRETQTEFGLYLVGWFASPHWKGEGARSPSPDALEEVRSRLTAQARALSAEYGRRVEAFILDCQLHRLRR